jgi:predicted enzyme related to lactoylglutathione lyase
MIERLTSWVGSLPKVKERAWSRYSESAVYSSRRAIPRRWPPGNRQHLGVPVEPGQTYAAFTAAAAGEPAVWSAFPADTSYFGSGPAPFMINYRVRNLDAMLVQLRAAGAQVEDRVEEYDYGRFGWATDPEGNRFELWEPR